MLTCSSGHWNSRVERWSYTSLRGERVLSVGVNAILKLYCGKLSWKMPPDIGVIIQVEVSHLHIFNGSSHGTAVKRSRIAPVLTGCTKMCGGTLQSIRKILQTASCANLSFWKWVRSKLRLIQQTSCGIWISSLEGPRLYETWVRTGTG